MSNRKRDIEEHLFSSCIDAMAKQPPVHELEFLKLTRNHGELTNNLASIGISAPDVLEYAKHVCQCWFRLAEAHLNEAQKAHASQCSRAVLSRTYYAAYNASKAARYVTRGNVSLKGDDHGRASSELPTDIPNAAHWSQQIVLLYEHRLRADYDNWSDTAAAHSIDSEKSIALATEFLEVVRDYINGKYGMIL